MILKIDLERLFPSSNDDSRRKRMHFMKLLASQNDIVVNASASAAVCAQDGENRSTEVRLIAKAERSYFYRVVSGHMYEALLAFEKCRESGMIEVYRPLADNGEDLYERLKAACHDQALRQYLEAIRNRTFHYGYDGELTDEGIAIFGKEQTAASCRYLIAEDAIMARIHEQLGLRDGDAALLALHQRVTSLRQELRRFVDRFVATLHQRESTAFSRLDQLENRQ